MRRDARALLIIGFLILAGCGPEQTMPLRLGMNSWPAYELMYLAQEKGFFAAEGVNVRLVEYSSLGDTRRAFERGNVDGMLCTIVELLQARERSTRLPVAFLMTDFSNGSDVILAREAVSSVAELRSKRVGVEVAALGPFLLSRALERAGLGLADVTLVPMDQTDMPRAIAEGRVDAVVTYPPASTETLRGGAVRTLFTSAEIPGEIVDVVVLDASILERRVPDAEAIVRAWERSVQFATDHPAEAYAIMADREHVSVEEFIDALAGCRVLSSDEQRAYFVRGGVLEKVTRATDRALRAVGQIHGGDATSGATSSIALMPDGLRD